MKNFSIYFIIAVATSLLSGCGGSSNNDISGPVDPINTPASFAGDLSGSIDADQTTINGTVNVADPDDNEANTLAQTDVNGTFGSFTIDVDGAWSYAIDPSDSILIALGASDSRSDVFSISSVDGSTSTVTMTIEGINDLPVIASGNGVNSASIVNTRSEAYSGTIAISDPDEGESTWQTQQNVQTTYGSFSISASGAWAYTLDTNNTSVSALQNAQDNVNDIISILSLDGTSAQISINISGEEPPSGSGLVKGSVGDNDSVPEINCTQTFSSVSGLEDAVSFNMTPGETLCLAAGTYGDLDIDFGGEGTAEQPITVAAAVPGEVIIGGEAFIGMTGQYAVLQGFIFKDGEMGSSLIQTRANSNTACNHCRITDNAFIDMDKNQDNSTKWFQIYGQNNRFDHNYVSGKRTRGALFVIERGSDVGTEDRTQIDHNYFGNRPPKDGLGYAENSDNEYEGIRVGSSNTHTSDSFAVIEHNYFEGIDGEAEVISVKAGSVTVQHNTVRNSRGAIVSRHGEGTLIDNNFIFGDGNPFSAGIRFVDANHQVTNNYIEGIRYLASNFNGGILISNSDGSTSNGYQDVENVLVAHNTVVDSVNSINLFAGNRSSRANSVYLVNNLVVEAIGEVFVNADEAPNNSVFAGNYVYGQAFSDSDSISSFNGVTWLDSQLEKASDGLYRPTNDSPDITADTNPSIGSFSLPALDMDGEIRSSSTLSGSDEVFVNSQSIAASAVRAPLTKELVGPLSFTPPESEADIQVVNIQNANFDDASLNAWTVNNASITSDESEVFGGGVSVVLEDSTASMSQAVSIKAETNYTLSAFIKGNAQLNAQVGSERYSVDTDNSEYRFASVSFNSGSQTSIEINANIAQEVTNVVNINNADFDDDQDSWVVNEGTGIGQVQDSSNSASGADGSIKFVYNDTDSGSPYNPYIAQTVDVEANTDYTLEMYILFKSGDAQATTVLFGVHTSEAITGGAFANEAVLASKNSVYSDLDESSEGDDSFRPDIVSFNSGNNTRLTIFAQYQSTTGDEIRVDDFSLSSQGPPNADTKAYFDEFRLISHPSLAVE